MERIGIAASKMAKGNLLTYNFYVIVFSLLFSIMIFVLAGMSIIFSLFIIGYVLEGLSPDMAEGWNDVIKVCMIALTLIVCGIDLFAMLRNLKIWPSRARRNHH